MTKTWIVRDEAGRHFDDFAEGGFVALGGEEAQPDLSSCATREDVEAAVAGLWTNEHARTRKRWALEKYRFACEVHPGDGVVMYDRSKRIYLVGAFAGGYKHNARPLEHKQHFRDVVWKGTVHRDSLDQASKDALVYRYSIYAIDDHAAKAIRAALEGSSAAPSSGSGDSAGADDTSDPSSDLSTVPERASEAIKDALAALEWDEMQEVLAGVLRAMGYKASVSRPGPDGGRDILASPDGLGLESPRIVAEVKHRKDPSSAPQIRSFIGGLQSNDRGLFLSTGGFTKDSRVEAMRSSVPLTLIDLDDLVSLLTDHYEQADSRLRTLVPLRAVYMPAGSD